MGCHSLWAKCLGFIEPLFGTFLDHMLYDRKENKWRFALRGGH
jgi:hypothetical protein